MTRYFSVVAATTLSPNLPSIKITEREAQFMKKLAHINSSSVILKVVEIVSPLLIENFYQLQLSLDGEREGINGD